MRKSTFQTLTIVGHTVAILGLLATGQYALAVALGVSLTFWTWM